MTVEGRPGLETEREGGERNRQASWLSNAAIGAFLGLLMLCAALLVAGRRDWAEGVAKLAFFLLLAGLLGRLAEAVGLPVGRVEARLAMSGTAAGSAALRLTRLEIRHPRPRSPRLAMSGTAAGSAALRLARLAIGHPPPRSPSRLLAAVAISLSVVGLFAAVLSAVRGALAASCPPMGVLAFGRTPQAEDAGGLDVVFGDRLQLRRARFPTLARPGSELRLELSFAAVGPVNDDVRSFVHLSDPWGQTIVGTDLRYDPKRARCVDGLPTIEYVLPLPPRFAQSVAYYRVGTYEGHPENRLPISRPAGNHPGDTFIVGRVVVGGGDALPGPPHPLEAVLGDELRLIGYKVNSAVLFPGDKLFVALYWRRERKIDHNYTIFVHVLDRNGKIVAQDDSPPKQRSYPTSVWQEGEMVIDDHAIQLPTNLPDDAYEIVAGAYLYPALTRLSLRQPGPAPNGFDLIRLAWMKVEADDRSRSGQSPAFSRNRLSKIAHAVQPPATRATWRCCAPRRQLWSLVTCGTLRPTCVVVPYAR